VKTNFHFKDEVQRIDEEILRLSIKFNFVTPLTSMVVTKPDNDVIADDAAPTPISRPIPRRYNSGGKAVVFVLESF